MNGPWHIGDVVIHKVTEEEAGYNTIERFLPNLTPQTLARNVEWFDGNGYDAHTRTVLLSYHCYLVQTPDCTVLIDSCIGNDKSIPVRDEWTNRRGTRWLAEFSATGVAFDDIDYVVCTHLHADHVGWNTRWDNGQWTPTFPNARYVVVQAEHDFTRDWVTKHGAGAPLAPVYAASYQESVRPIIEAGRMDLVTAHHTIGEYFRFIPTPGHTPGHVAIAVGRGHDVAVFTGDLIHSPIQARYPDIVMPTDDDPGLAAVTRREFLARYSDSDTLVCTMHFPAPSVGYLRPWLDGHRLDQLTA